MNFAVGFDLILPHNLMEPMLRELPAIRVVWVYIEPQKFECPWQGIIIVWRDLEVVFSSN